MWQALIPVLGTIFDKVIPDPQAAADAKLRVMELAQRGELAVLEAEAKIATGQLEINKADAQSNDWVQRRWRPMAGWVCVFGLAYSFLFQPLFPWVIAVVALALGSDVQVPPLPPIDIEYLIGLLSALLGLGGFRTFERIRGKV